MQLSNDCFDAIQSAIVGHLLRTFVLRQNLCIEIQSILNQLRISKDIWVIAKKLCLLLGNFGFYSRRENALFVHFQFGANSGYHRALRSGKGAARQRNI